MGMRLGPWEQDGSEARGLEMGARLGTWEQDGNEMGMIWEQDGNEARGLGIRWERV